MEGTSVFMEYYDRYASLKERFKQRFRVQSAVVRSKHRKRVAANAASMATTIAVARVFKGNVILARLASKFARDAKDQWRKRASSPFNTSSAGMPTSSSSSKCLPSLSSAVGATVAAGAVASVAGAAAADPAHAEAMIMNQGDAGSSAVRPVLDATFDVRLKPIPETTVKKKRRSQEAELKLVDELAGREETPFMKALQSVAVPLLGNVCHVFMHGLNRIEIYGAEKLRRAVKDRPAGQPLITVCNHVASMDDPLVMASLLPPRLMMDASLMRWTLCATDRCFTNSAAAAFFTSVKVLPLIRGAGINQKGVDTAISKLQRGDWVHIFPEGSRSRDGGKTLASVKRGIGRLVLDAGQPPLLVPFIHAGMQRVIPIGKKLPTTGASVSVIVGDPIPLDDLIAAHSRGDTPQSEIYDEIAARVGKHMQALKAELDSLVELRQLDEAQARHVALSATSSSPSLLGLLNREMDPIGLGAALGNPALCLELGLAKPVDERAKVSPNRVTEIVLPEPSLQSEKERAEDQQNLAHAREERHSDHNKVLTGSLTSKRAVTETAMEAVRDSSLSANGRANGDETESVSGEQEGGVHVEREGSFDLPPVVDEFLDDWEEDELRSGRWARGHGFGFGTWREWKEGMQDMGFAARGLLRSGDMAKVDDLAFSNLDRWPAVSERKLGANHGGEMDGAADFGKGEAPVKWARTKAVLAALRRDLWAKGWMASCDAQKS